jgi:uncharacterized protein YndB with AHSA1/START domain
MAIAERDNELRLVRVFDAPVALVWDAWVKDEHVTHWWGPRGFTLTTKSKDVRTGGKWIYTMHGPDGTDYPNVATYLMVEPHAKLVYDHGANEEREALFRVTVTFQERHGRTHMDMTMTLATAEAARQARDFIKRAGGESTWDRFGEYLEEIQGRTGVFLINRSFAADQRTLFDMWVTPEHYVQWMGPRGSAMSFLRADVREGGSALWAMTMADGSTKHGVLGYRTIRPCDLFVYSQHFSDSSGSLRKPSFAPTYPDRLLTTVTFTPEGANETRVTVRWEILGDATAGERETFDSMKTSMTPGWTDAFDKLEASLASARA